MKIGILCYWNYGGSAAVAAQLGQHLAGMGHQIHFISGERPFRLEQYHANVYLHHPGQFHYPVFSVPPYFLLEVNKVIEVVQTHHLDIIHAHYAVPHCITAVMARQVLNNGIPVVTTLHGTDITLVGRHKEFFQLTKYGLESSDAVTVVSHALGEDTQRVFQLSTPPSVVYNFIDMKRFSRRYNPELRRRFAGSGEKIIIHISNFRPVKRVVDVIETFNNINHRIPSRLVLVGDGPDMPQAREKVSQLNLLDNVHFLGEQEEIVPLLSISDLMLLPSRRESFGLVALEALACQVPVVASRVGGLPEVVSHGHCGYLADPEDLPAMADYGVKILEDEHLHKKFSQWGRTWAQEQFAPNRWVDKYLQIYTSLVDGRK